MYKFKFSYLLSLFCLCVSILAATQAHALTLKNLRFGQKDSATRIVLDMDQPTRNWRVFTLANPYRLIIDVEQSDWQSSPTLPGHVRPVISDLRYGTLKPGVSRIVFELAKPSIPSHVFTLPADSGKNPRLVIDLERATPERFQAQIAKIHGDFNPDTPVVQSQTQPPTILNKPVPTPEEKPSSVASPLRKRIIVIDAGHGGQDPGAIGKGGTHEKSITLALARALRDALNQTGRYTVYLTRDNDTYIRLRERSNIARRKNADLFISLHADSIGKGHVRGASVYTLSTEASDSETAQLAARENRSDIIAGLDLSGEPEEITDILLDLAMRDTMNQSRFFANTLVSRFQKDRIRILERPHRHAGFAVLKSADTPSVLIEAGFMSNRKEEELLSTPAYRRQISKVITAAIDDYFETISAN